MISIAVSVFAPNLKDEQVCLEFLPDSIELPQSNQGSGGLDLKNRHFLKLNQMLLAKKTPQLTIHYYSDCQLRSDIQFVQISDPCIAFLAHNLYKYLISNFSSNI